MTLWEKMLVDIRSEFQNKKRFLQHKTISRTISPNQRKNTLMHLDYVKKDKYFLNEVLPKVLDSTVGGPKLFRGVSQGTAQHCHYLMVMEIVVEVTHFKVMEKVLGK